jgi:hypothetical protein
MPELTTDEAVFGGAWCYESARHRAGLSVVAAGGSAMRKGLVSSDVNHTGIEGPVKVREKLQPAEERVDG